MKKKKSFFARFYVVICLAFFYLPILVTMFFSFNSSKSLTRFTGFSLRWYNELLQNVEISKAVYVSLSIAVCKFVLVCTVVALAFTGTQNTAFFIFALS